MSVVSWSEVTYIRPTRAEFVNQCDDRLSCFVDKISTMV